MIREALAAVHPVAVALALLGWLAILPIRFRMWARLALQVVLFAASGLAQALTRGHGYGWWAFVVLLGSWIPTLWWYKQVVDDQLQRERSGLPELWPGSTKRNFWLNGPSWSRYRCLMTQSATSWNPLWEDALVKKRVPGWMQTRPLTPGTEPAASHPQLDTAALLAELRRQGLSGPAWYFTRDADAEVVIVVAPDSHEQLDTNRVRRALRRACGRRVTVLRSDTRWHGRRLEPLQ